MKLKERFHHIFEDKFTAILIFVILAFVVMLLLNVGNRFFHRDELEHIHSSWYVASNYLPYVDFFQSHHPLLWFILAPFILVFGDSTAILFVARAFMLLCFLGTVGLVYRMGILITEKKQIALISATLLLSSLAFSQKGIETRRETPQAFFAVLFVYYLISFLKQRGTTLSAASLDQGQPGQAVNVRYNKIFLAGLAASIAFLFLQKFIFLLAIVLIIFIYMLYKRNITFKAIVFFLLGFIGPLSLLIVYLLVTGSFSDYILNCWQVPARILYSFSPHHTIIGLAIENFIFWVLVITAAISLFSPKKKTVNRELRLLTFLGILLVPIFTLVLSLPNKENFLLPIALCALPAGYAFGEV